VPNSDRIVLEIARRGRTLVGNPLFFRGEQLPLARGRVKVREGSIALCRVDRRGAQPIVELGRVDRARDVVAALLAERGLRPTFPKRLEHEAREAAERVRADPGPRTDLTAEPTFTVDPTTARDFDDAVSARREGDGFRLWIHIADVSAHVRPESGLDREARERANSTYAPGIVSPMLPRALSDEACSLVPGVDRFAVTSEIELKGDGTVTAARFYRSVIRSDVRLDYDGLDRIFAGKERAPEPVADAVTVARAAAKLLDERFRGEALEVSGDEPEFTFDDTGHVEAAQVVRQTEAHRLIERLMVLTNEQVALLTERKGVPSMYRVHEQPEPARVEHLIEQLDSLDVPTPPVPQNMTPREAGSLAVQASTFVAAEARRRGHGASTLSSLVLRSLKPARYSERNLGHAGLGLAAYAHFTSPIRRYPDLIAHRALLSVVGAGEQPADRHEVGPWAEHCSETERDSMKIERTGDDICLAFLLDRELFQSGWDHVFEGEVSGVVGAGAFVRFRGEMSDAYEGFLPARLIPGDRYELNELDSALVGLRKGRRIGFGDPVEVRVSQLEAPRGRVTLEPPERREKGSTRGRAQRQAKGRRRS
jgi:ribonuclease R